MKELMTGDELLCKGNGKMSKAIIWYNGLMGVTGPAKQISHVAKYIDGMVFEATTLNKWCGKKGYQKNEFAEWLRNYDGSVWVRHLEDIQIDDTEYIIEASKLLGRPYENGIPGVLELLLTSVAVKTPWLSDFARDHLQTKEIHCSEANVKLSQMMNYYDLQARPNKLPPYQFWTGGLYEKGILKGRLLDPIQIK